MRLRFENGGEEEFDHVILACHSDTSLKILEAGEGITKDEKDVLSMFQWNYDRVVLHSDPKVRLI